MSGIVGIARTWIGTPYVHQAATKGAGCDCLGLLRGVWAEVSGRPIEPVPAYSADWAEPQGDERLWRAMAERLTLRSGAEAQPGDILLFRMRQDAVAKHLGIQACVGRRPSFIHAYQGHGVVESQLTAGWARRVVARFAAPAEH